MQLEIKGAWDIVAVDLSGRVVWKKHIDNLLMAVNQSVRDALLMGTYDADDPATDISIKYFAFGDGTSTPTVNDTRLASERYRKQVTQITNPQAGTVSSAVSLGTNEADFVITEIGVFGGAATSTANSGTLLSRVLVNIPNNSNIVLNIYRTDTCSIGG